MNPPSIVPIEAALKASGPAPLASTMHQFRNVNAQEASAETNPTRSSVHSKLAAGSDLNKILPPGGPKRQKGLQPVKGSAGKTSVEHVETAAALACDDVATPRRCRGAACYMEVHHASPL